MVTSIHIQLVWYDMNPCGQIESVETCGTVIGDAFEAVIVEVPTVP